MTDIVEMVNVTHPLAWMPWAVSYFFLVGISVASMLLALPGFAFGVRSWQPAGRLALWAALACGIAAPVALLADLHQPGRFWRFYLHPNLGSWMAIGSFMIPGYLGGLMLFAWGSLRGDLAAATGDGWLARMQRAMALGGASAPAWRTLGAMLAVAFGSGVLLYTGMETMIVRARVLWNSPLVPLELLVTALAGAIGLVLVLNRVAAQPGSRNACDGSATASLSRFATAALLLSLAIDTAWLLSGRFGLDPAAAAVLAAVAGSSAWQWTAIWIGLAPLIALGLCLAAPVRAGWLVGLVALQAAWMFRWTLFIGGQTIPKTGAGLYDYHLPAGSEGLLGIVGVVGLCLFLLIVLDAVLPLQPRAPKPGLSPRRA